MKKQKKTSLSIAPYLELSKTRIVTLVLITAGFGYFLGGQGEASWRKLLFFLIGLGMVTAGSSALNHYAEREVDKKMERTRNRPLPSGLLEPESAFSFGVFMILTGLFVLCLYSNLLAAFLSLLAAFLYVLVYTPMKKISWMNTTIGAIPGALPPLIGWVAATESLGLGGWCLFLILFLWQHPHFYSIAWMCRDDYARGGFKMLPVIDPSGRRMSHQIIFYSLVLIPASLLPTLIGLSGKIYLAGALFLSLAFFASGIVMIKTKTYADAKKLLKASVIYLPLLFVLLITDSFFA